MASPSDACREKLSATLLDPVQAAAIDVGPGVESAVLVPLYAREGHVHAIFTERHHELPRHAGEISFPGGRRDPEDPDLIATALREAHEEVGLDPEDVEIVGALLPVQTIAQRLRDLSIRRPDTRRRALGTERDRGCGRDRPAVG